MSNLSLADAIRPNLKEKCFACNCTIPDTEECLECQYIAPDAKNSKICGKTYHFGCVSQERAPCCAHKPITEDDLQVQNYLSIHGFEWFPGVSMEDAAHTVASKQITLPVSFQDVENASKYNQSDAWFALLKTVEERFTRRPGYCVSIHRVLEACKEVDPCIPYRTDKPFNQRLLGSDKIVAWKPAVFKAIKAYFNTDLKDKHGEDGKIISNWVLKRDKPMNLSKKRLALVEEDEQWDGELVVDAPEKIPPKRKPDVSNDRTSGGCDARTLSAVGVFRNEAEAKACLNAEIDSVFAKFLVNDPSCPRSHAGVDDEEWSNEVVARAVDKMGWHMVKVQRLEGKNELKDVDLKSVFENGSYFVDGYLNTCYMRNSKCETIRVAGTSSNKHRHSTAVVDGKVVDHSAFIEGGEMPTSCLWLSGSKPDPEKGYMRQIHRVYKVFPCNGTGCEGCRFRKKRRRLETEAKTPVKPSSDLVSRLPSFAAAAFRSGGTKAAPTLDWKDEEQTKRFRKILQEEILQEVSHLMCFLAGAHVTSSYLHFGRLSFPVEMIVSLKALSF